MYLWSWPFLLCQILLMLVLHLDKAHFFQIREVDILCFAHRLLRASLWEGQVSRESKGGDMREFAPALPMLCVLIILQATVITSVGVFPFKSLREIWIYQPFFLLEITIEIAGLWHPSGVCGSETDASGAATEIICTYVTVRGWSPSVEDFVTGVNCVSNSQSIAVVVPN